MATLHDEFIAAVVAGRGHKPRDLAHLLADAADSGSRGASGNQPARNKKERRRRRRGAPRPRRASAVATSAGHALYVHSSAAPPAHRLSTTPPAESPMRRRRGWRGKGTRRRRRRRFVGAVDAMCFWRNSTKSAFLLDDAVTGTTTLGDEEEGFTAGGGPLVHGHWAHDVEVSGTPEPYGGAAALARAAGGDRGDCLSGAALARRGLFDGSVYPGRVAVEVGFADHVGDLGTARRRYGHNVELRRFALLRNAIGYRRRPSSSAATVTGSSAVALVKHPES